MPELTIEAVRARAVVAPLPWPITTASGTIRDAPLILIDLVTREGVVGHSYLFAYTALILRPLRELVESIGATLTGKPVTPRVRMAELDAQFRLLGRQGMVAMSFAGLDMAMWDALGKARDMSVAVMLGGVDAPIPCYDSRGIFEPERDRAMIEASLARGFKAIKIKLGSGTLADDMRRLGALRDLVGDEVRLMVDYNQSLSVPEAIRRIRHIEAVHDLDWIEEPVAAEDFAGHVAIRSQVRSAIQTGENWWLPEDAARAIGAGICDHVMLDLMKIGGLSGWQRAAAMAEAASLPVSSHLFVEASAHALAITPNACWLEYLDVAGAVLSEPPAVVDGKLAPRGPGLGLHWNEAAIARLGD